MHHTKGPIRRVLCALLLLAALAAVGCGNAPKSGQIGVVRNGGSWDDTAIRDAQHGGSGQNKSGVLCPNSANKWNGFGSTTHQYPGADQQRTFKFNDDEDADTGPIGGLRTKDGYKTTLSGTVFFKTAFDCTPAGIALVKKFDQANYSRPAGQQPWSDFPGWLENQWKPILDNTARNTLLGFDAKQVLSSAALLSGDEDAAKAVDNVDNKSNVQAIEKALADGLTTQLKAKLGDDFFTDIVVNMEQPQLPDIDGGIAKAQAAFASVAEVRAEKQRQIEQVQVEIEKRKVADERAKGYRQCESCARQDELKALPDGIQTLVLGSGSPIALGK